MEFDNKFKVCIAIPIYKNTVDGNEKKSLLQALNIFSSHSIIFFHPYNLDLSEFKNICSTYHASYFFEAFDDRHFVNTQSYNSLIYKKEFYQRFEQFEFMLLYQLDAYVFRDELKFWCNAGFDYIGAPWFKNHDTSGQEKEFIQYAGNGGFSLRNIKSILLAISKELDFVDLIKLRRILKPFKMKLPYYIFIISLIKKIALAEAISIKDDELKNEDIFFALILPQISPQFKSAKFNEAIPFAFEAMPEKLFKMNGDKLPFGCHGWYKYSKEFWKNFIK